MKQTAASVWRGEEGRDMGNKSKRIQGRAAILDEWGLPCGSKQVDAGYSGCKKNRHLRGGLTKMAMDAEAIKRLRRERRRARRTEKARKTAGVAG